MMFWMNLPPACSLWSCRWQVCL